MRWLLGRDPGSCDACGAELERGAAWCGACGARTDGADPDSADEPAVAAEPDTAEDGPPEAAPRWPPHRQVMVAALVLAVAAAVVAVQPSDGPAEPLLGQLSQHTGMSATGPPPSGLRLAWAHEPPAGNIRMGSSLAPWAMTVHDGRVRVGRDVVDLDSGQLVRTAAGGMDSGAEWAMVEAGELVVLDQLTGEVLHRAAVTGDWQERNPWAFRPAGGDVTLFGFDQTSVLVADDGSVIAEVEGRLSGSADRALAAPAALPVRDVMAGAFDERLTAPVRLVAAATGEVVLDLPDTGVRVVDVVGDLAMVAETDARVDNLTSPAGTSDVPWIVRLVDARSGEEQSRLDVGSREPPRLLGTFGDGTAVIAARSGDEFPLRAVTPDGSASTIARAQPPPRRTGGFVGESSSLNAAAMTGDVLVVSAGSAGVVALDRTGQRLWTLDAPIFTGLRADGGHVAVLPDDDGGRIRIARATDGEVVTSLPTEGPRWDVATTPLAALAGHVGLRPTEVFMDQDLVLGATTWLDLRTGEPATLEDVFSPFLPGDAAGGVDRSWRLHGTVPTTVGGDGAQAGPVEQQTGGGGEQTGGVQQDTHVAEPVMTRFRPGSVLELLEPREGFTQFALPVPGGADVGGEGFQSIGQGIRLLGATADRMAVLSERFDDHGQRPIHVLHRTTGEVTTMQGPHGIALVGDVLLAAEIDEARTAATLVAIDAATGERRWSAPPLEGALWLDPPRVDDELVVDMGVARVTARSLRDGAQAWTHASATELTDKVVLGPRHVAVATTAGEVVALDRDDGAVAWRAPVGIPIASITGAGDHVLVGTHDGLVVHLDGRGREVQRIVVGSGPVDAVAAFGDTVIATVDERVVGLRPDGTGITRDDQVELP